MWLLSLILLFASALSALSAPLTSGQKAPLARTVLHTSQANLLSFTLSDEVTAAQFSNGEWLLTPKTGTFLTDHNGFRHPVYIEWIAIPPGHRAELVAVRPLEQRSFNGSLARVTKIPTEAIDRLDTPDRWGTLDFETTLLGSRAVRLVINAAVNANERILTSSRWQVEIRFLPDVTKANEPATCQAPLPDYVVNKAAADNWRQVRVASQRSIFSTNALPTDALYRITTNNEGITVVTGEDLQRVGVNLSSIDVTTLKLYGSSAKPLSESLTAAVPENWIELAILVEDGGDNIFDANDRVLFFGEKSSGWASGNGGSYAHWLSPYTTSATYFLTLDRSGTAGKRMARIDNAGSETALPNAIGRVFLEDDISIYNDSSFPGSGTRWVGQLFSGNIERGFTIPLTGAITSSPLSLITRWLSLTNSTQPTNIVFSWNGTPFDTVFALSGYYSTSIPASILREGNNSLFVRKSGDASFYIDWIEAEYTRDWAMRSNRLIAETSIGSRYRVSLSNAVNPYVFEVRDRENVRWIRSTTFADSGTKRYFAAEEAGFFRVQSLSPVTLGGTGYTDLRSSSLQADYILLYQDDYEAQAQRLAQYRREHNNVSVVTVRIQDVFDQFASGNLDPVAIRNFLRYAFQSWQRPAPAYVLFMGDGDYDYRGIVQPHTKRPIPSYQIYGTCTDDFYVRFGSQYNPPELVTARLPLQSPQLIDNWIDKLIQYETAPPAGQWRNKFVLCADDEYGDGARYASWETTHTMASEALDQSILPPYLERVKIYLIEYPGYYDPIQVANLKPDATAALITELERGALIVNWIGHGNPRVWAHEQLLRESRDLSQIKTGGKLPLWLAFTCDWAYWDDPELQSFPEKLLGLNENGAIGVIAATRLTGPEANERLAEQYFVAQFDTTFQPRRTIATALMIAKARAGNLTNSSYYHSMCDPLTRLSIADRAAWVDSIQPSPLVPMAAGSVVGKVGPQTGTLDPTADGTVNISIRGARVARSHLWGSDSRTSPYTYYKPGRLLFRGSASITNGEFHAPVMLPLDATYGDSNATALIYASGEWGSAAGYKPAVSTALEPATVNDSIGPVIKLYLNSREYKNGDVVDNTPVLIADISDSSGVNLTGELGHRILATIDAKVLDYTEQFAYAVNDLTKGTLETPLNPLAPGKHTISLQVFDGANNPSFAEIDFEVVNSSSGVALKNPLNYPNPVEKNSIFTFESTASGSGTIDIYSVHGTRIRSFGPFPVSVGYNSPPDAQWDARDRDGVEVANGAYLWKVKITSTDGRSAYVIGRAAVLR
ncbi:MAG: type IX secretion system sortase PorU [bacterium]|nr:type IX secretion system sortase PorU [bacterium]